MTILITGSAGQVGRELVDDSTRRGYAIVACDSAELDITDGAAVMAAFARFKPSLVINAAAYTAVDKAESEAEKAHAVNAQAVRHLASAALKASCPVFHISTDYVFDGSKQGPYTEQDEPNPTSVYGRSKLDGEQLLRQTLPAHRILRVSWVFGRHGNNFVKTMLRLGRERDVLKIVHDQYGAPTSAAAIAHFLLDWAAPFVHSPVTTAEAGVVLESGPATMTGTQAMADQVQWGTYHFESNPGVTWYEFAVEIFAQAHALGLVQKVPQLVPITSAEFPTPVKRPANSKLASVRLPDPGHLGDWKAHLNDVLRAL